MYTMHLIDKVDTKKNSINSVYAHPFGGWTALCKYKKYGHFINILFGKLLIPIRHYRHNIAIKVQKIPWHNEFISANNLSDKQRASE